MLGLPMLAAATPAGVVSLLGGAAMAYVRAPLRATGETLDPVLRIGWRRRHVVAPLLEGVILLARGVPSVGSRYVRCSAALASLSTRAWFGGLAVVCFLCLG